MAEEEKKKTKKEKVEDTEKTQESTEIQASTNTDEKVKRIRYCKSR